MITRKKITMKSFKELFEENHTTPAPKPKNVKLHELDSVMPGIYSNNGYMKYGHGDERLDKISHEVIRFTKGVRGRIHVYKAIPRGSQKSIKKGDWVTINNEYAKAHGATMDDHDIISKRVSTEDLYSDGSSIHEFGYHPSSETSKKKVRK
jgi:hypothetical protein